MTPSAIWNPRVPISVPPGKSKQQPVRLAQPPTIIDLAFITNKKVWVQLMLPYIIGMIFSGLLIAFNEPLAKLTINLSRRVIGVPVTDAVVHRAKISLIIYGTLYMIFNALVIKWLILS